MYTFESFCQHIKGAFGNSPLITIVPVFAIMDYKKYYDSFLDKKLKAVFSKVEGTQLYFKFQPLRPADVVNNPFGLLSRTNYKKNGQEYTVMLRLNEGGDQSDLPFIPHLQHSQWIPENAVNATCAATIQPCIQSCPCREHAAGISFLKQEPYGYPEPIKFEPWINDHQVFLGKINEYFTRRGGDTRVYDHWMNFTQLFLPSSDSSEEYFRRNCIPIPLSRILFKPGGYFGTDGEISTALLNTNELNTLTGFSSNSNAVRRSMFDIDLMDHIRQSTQTIPWRGHHTVCKNWDFSKEVLLQRVIVKKGAAGGFIIVYYLEHIFFLLIVITFFFRSGSKNIGRNCSCMVSIRF